MKTILRINAAFSFTAGTGLIIYSLFLSSDMGWALWGIGMILAGMSSILYYLSNRLP